MRNEVRIRSHRCLLLLRVCGIVLLASSLVFAQESPKPADDLETKSLPLRTALYHDPTLAPPLDRLVQLYREAGKLKDLVAVYRQHVAQYPADTGALIVLIRLLGVAGDPDASRLARSAAEQHPENAFLQFLLFEHLQRTREPGALDALDRAIAKETLPARKRAWIEQLLPLAKADNRPELAQTHLQNLATESRTPDEKLDVARKLIAQKLHEPALAVLDSAVALAPSAETGVDIELAAASADLGLQRNDAAAARLDRLLGRLAADYWRRAEILHRRTALVKSDVERETMLNAARARRKAAPESDQAALELSQLLAAFEFRREALQVLLDATQRLPASERIEKAALDLFDLLRDERGREAFLADSLRRTPDRHDLAVARSRSLFLLGRRSDALAAWDALAAKLDPSTRLIQMLELARFLRRSALHAEADEMFQRAVTLAPGRLEVRRELAETWLAIGQKQKAREAFAGALAEEAETENLLDVVQLFLKQEMLSEAKSAVATRVAREPHNFDLRLVQLAVAARLADQRDGEKLIADTLALADTDARYRRWLEGAVAFHEAFETDAAFLEGEQKRLVGEPGGWGPGFLERRLIFAEVAAAHGRKAEVAAMLSDALGTDLAPEVKIQLRRRQFALLENDPAQAQAAEEQLKALIADDPAHADEYRIRLVLLYMRGKRTDLASALLYDRSGTPVIAGADLGKVNDAALLAGLEAAIREIRGGEGDATQLNILERITTLEPANRGAWERWLTTLAAAGDEERLRVGLQRLLAGIDRLPLPEETRKLLQDHLLASHWRSLALLLDGAGRGSGEGGDGQARLVEALPLLESAGRLADSPEEWLWITWTRAYTLNRLGRKPARDEAIRELERMVAQSHPVSQDSSIGTGSAEALPRDMVIFPDGLAIALSVARELLTTLPSAQPGSLSPVRSVPQGTARVRWAFETDGRTPVAKVMPLDKTRVLIVDTAGRLYGVDAANGKLIWARQGPRPVVAQGDESGGHYGGGYGANAPSVSMPLHHQGKLFLAVPDAIECWSAEDGRLLWRTLGITPGAGPQLQYPALFAHGDRLLVCDAFAASIASLDMTTGKAQWLRSYPAGPAMFPLHPFNSGASYSQGRVLLYGSATRIVSAENGDVQWSFDPQRVKSFPITLGEASGQNPPAPMPASFGRRSYRGFGGYSAGSTNFIAIDYQMRAQYGQRWNLQPGQQLAFTGAAAAWAGATGEGGQPRFAVLQGEYLLLFSQQGMRSLRLDLPFAAPQPAGNGTFIGIAGRSVCLLTVNALQITDLNGTSSTQIPLTAAAPEQDAGDPEDEAPMQISPELFEAAVDGPLVYVSSRRGLAAYHVRTRQRIWRAAWPKSVAPPDPSPVSQASATYFLPQAYVRNVSGAYGSTSTIASAVHDGVFYTTTEPSRVVALTGEEAAP